ncbi:MAG TPA: prolyl-tRNA synthetase associated domain-containing protein [Candidatus Eisenbergiella merdipullorum]|uniref:Prolyl-tRNA synthetase associated domain-containing protein n=1 Tax=Candidatus Eisenbergiella merdipullorum TaxID=2838553 RepID=A0A9D2L1D0_9FIRM|nr:prolyl-tRNA synthetase associated domain-containing protein [Candidatus Eisenbergiella merdipullorum]
MHLMKGRPEALSGRQEREIRVYDLLDRLNIEYEYVDHAPMRTMEDCLEVDRILNAAICKNLFLCDHQKTAYYLLMLPGAKKFHSGEVSRLAGSSRLSFAPPEDMERLLDLSPGAVSVLGLMNDHEGQVRLLIDEEILKQEYFGCHPCVNTTSLRLAFDDLTGKILKEIGHEPLLLHLS